MKYTRSLISVPFLLVLLLVTACAPPTHTDRVSADWSRGVRLGTSLTSDTPALALQPEHDRLFLVWPALLESTGQEVLHVVGLDLTSGAIVEEHDLEAPGGNPRLPALLPAADNGFHLLWLDGPYTERDLYHLLLDEHGVPNSAPYSLSPPRQQVLDTQAISLEDGGIAVYWTTRSGLSLLRLNGEGQSQSAPLLLPGISSPGMAADTQGRIHLAWLEPASLVRYLVRYTVLEPGTNAFPVPQTITTLILSPDQTLDDISGPVVAMEGDGIYIFWTRLLSTMMDTSEIASFTFIADGITMDPTILSLSSFLPPPYQPVTDVAGLSLLAPPIEQTMGRADVHDAPIIVPGRPEQTLIAVSLELQTRSRESLQPTLVVLEDGEVKGYSVVAWTNFSSVAVSGASGETGELYAAWVDAIGIPTEHPVYLSTTSDALMPVFNRLTTADLLNRLSINVQRMIQGVVILPLGAMWMVLPFIWLFVALWFGGGNVQGRFAAIALLVAIILHWISKYVVTPSLLVLLPRLGYAPPNLVPLITYLVPAVTVGIGVVVSLLFYVRPRRGEFSPLVAYVIVAMTDLLLSLSIHGLAYTE